MSEVIPQELLNELKATNGQVITCKAAVAWEPKKPLDITDIQVRTQFIHMYLFSDAHFGFTYQGCNKLLRSGGTRHLIAMRNCKIRGEFWSFPQKTGGARASLATPVPTSLHTTKIFDSCD